MSQDLKSGAVFRKRSEQSAIRSLKSPRTILLGISCSRKSSASCVCDILESLWSAVERGTLGRIRSSIPGP